MYYIQLSQNYRDFDKVRILEIHFYEMQNVVNKKLSLKYQVYKNVGDAVQALFDKNINITDPSIIGQLEQSAVNPSINLWDNIHYALMQYIVSNLESGTIEVE